MLPFSFYYNSAQEFALLNVMCSHVGIVTAAVIHTYRHLLCLQDTFIPTVIQAFSYFTYTFILNKKTSFIDI
jgi:hypothetical protein